MQFELALDDWRLISSAPKNATWIRALLSDGQVARIHWAQDLSGEEQLSFRGWFYDTGTCFYEVFPPPIRWTPES